MGVPRTSLKGLTVTQLKEQAKVKYDDGVPFLEWSLQTARVTRSATEADTRGALEEAYVEYMRAASMFSSLLHHPDLTHFKHDAVYKDLLARVMSSIPRAKQLGELLEQRSPPANSAAGFPSVKSRIRSLELSTMATSPTSSSAPIFVGAATVPLNPAATASSPRRALPNLPDGSPRPAELAPSAPILPAPDAGPSNSAQRDSRLEARLRGLRSPSDFAQAYPDIDTLDAPTASALRSFPSVPFGRPSESDNAASLPPPPQPFDTPRQTMREGELQNDTSLGMNLDTTPESGPSRLPQDFDMLKRRDLARQQAAEKLSMSPPSLYRGPQSNPKGSSGQAPPPLPLGSSLLPETLMSYFRTAASINYSTRVLFLDIRSREAFESLRLKSVDIVCLDPTSLRQGLTSTDIEEGLVISPSKERQLFMDRATFEYIVMYDARSVEVPSAPPIGASEEQSRLWNLSEAIYSQEYIKPLRRPPMLLVGGLAGWQKAGGPVIGSGTRKIASLESSPTSLDGFRLGGTTTSREPLADIGSNRYYGQTEGDVKKLRRQAAVVNGAIPSHSTPNSPYTRSATDLANGGFPTSTYTEAGAYFSKPSAGLSGYQSPYGVATPPLALPQVSLQRSAIPASYDGRPLDSVLDDSLMNTNGRSGRAAYAQPLIGGQHPVYNSPRGSDQGSFIPYVPSASTSTPKSSIDYPMVNSTSRRPPIPSHVMPNGIQTSFHPQPPPPVASAPTPLTRPTYTVPTRSQHNYTSLISPASPYSPMGDFNMMFGSEAVGLTGLKNLGNTCYMNSIIQCISATIPLARFLKDGSYRKQINRLNPLGTKGQLAEAIAELIRVLWSTQYNFVSAVSFREAFCRFHSQFRGSDQHDAQEFLAFFLDGLHEDLNRVIQKPKPVTSTLAREAELEVLPIEVASKQEWELYKCRDNSIIVDLFQGQYRSRLQCLTCKTTSTTYNTFMYLSLPIPTGRGLSRVTLLQCIEAYLKEETLDKDDSWNCPKCKTRRKATKSLSLTKLPPVLLIHLKRFSVKGPFTDKMETQVQYPLYGMDLSKYMPFESSLHASKPVAPTPSTTTMTSWLGSSSVKPPHSHAGNGGHVYDLFGICNHFGSLSSGHYTAFVRSRADWHNLDDTRISRVDESVVQNARSAYLLSYHRREF